MSYVILGSERERERERCGSTEVTLTCDTNIHNAIGHMKWNWEKTIEFEFWSRTKWNGNIYNFTISEKWFNSLSK